MPSSNHQSSALRQPSTSTVSGTVTLANTLTGRAASPCSPRKRSGGGSAGAIETGLDITPDLTVIEVIGTALLRDLDAPTQSIKRARTGVNDRSFIGTCTR
jgi:hypothetical protein